MLRRFSLFDSLLDEVNAKFSDGPKTSRDIPICLTGSLTPTVKCVAMIPIPISDISPAEQPAHPFNAALFSGVIATGDGDATSAGLGVG